MFYGESFIYDGIASEEFGLMLYEFDGNGQSDVDMTSVGSVVEDWIPSRYSNIDYGIQQNDALSFALVFGLNPLEVNAGKSIDRWDVQKIASWLTGLDTPRWLSIEQPDLEDVRYKCRFTSLTPLSINGEIYAFSATVTCDSGFAYLAPREYSVTSAGGITLHSESSMNGLYYPRLEISISGGGALKVTNSTNGTGMAFKNLPSAEMTITVDGLNGVIKSSEGLNMYSYLDGFDFLALSRGDNEISVTADSTATVVKIICEFPVNVGA